MGDMPFYRDVCARPRDMMRHARYDNIFLPRYLLLFLIPPCLCAPSAATDVARSEAEGLGEKAPQ